MRCRRRLTGADHHTHEIDDLRVGSGSITPVETGKGLMILLERSIISAVERTAKSRHPFVLPLFQRLELDGESTDVPRPGYSGNNKMCEI